MCGGERDNKYTQRGRERGHITAHILLHLLSLTEHVLQPLLNYILIDLVSRGMTESIPRADKNSPNAFPKRSMEDQSKCLCPSKRGEYNGITEKHIILYER